MALPAPRPHRRPRQLAVALTCVLAAFAPGPARAQPKARNVILMIADGMGFNHVLATDYWRGGEAGIQPYESFPWRMAVSTHSSDGTVYDPGAAWADFSWVASGATDSAASATAMATGVKTLNGAVGVDPAGTPLLTVLEEAEARGMRTGLVTSVPLSHATPAAFAAHWPDRGDYREIARQVIEESAVDVVMGAGHPWYDNDGARLASPGSFDYVGGEALWAGLEARTAGGDADGDGDADPWRLVQSRRGVRRLMDGRTPRRVFAVAPVAETLRQLRGGDAGAPPYAVSVNPAVPTLVEMTRAALNVLDNDPDGFFLMVEGGAVDWAAHASQPGRMIEEMDAFNRAVGAAVRWVRRHSSWRETLLVVVGDHETGYLTGPGSDPGWEEIVNNGAGVVPGLEWHGSGHTNSLVPVYARGAGAKLLAAWATGSDPLRGAYADNTAIASLIFAALPPARVPPPSPGR